MQHDFYNSYRNAIRSRIEQLKNDGNLNNFIVWDVQSDEARDATLLSLRVYGSRNHANVVMVACGVSGIWEPLPEKRIALPSLADVLALRRVFVEGMV